MSQPRYSLFFIAALLGMSTAALAQDVQSGIAAWQQGDYAKAVGEWRPLADGGNADAQFNLGQAYRLGRGVPQNLNLAEQWFERAARQRHDQAGASLGLLLFQNGRAREAMPWIQAAALHGDPRAQYVFGTALFNGDILRRDLPRAYAMMSMAAAQGFPQAQTQLAEMERQLAPEDRERGRQIAAEQNAGASRPQVAAAEPRAVPQPAITRPAEPARPRRVQTGPERDGAAPASPRAGVSYAAPPEDGREVRGERPGPAARPSPTRPVQTSESTRRVPGERHAAAPERPAQQVRPVARPTQQARPAQQQARPAATGGSWRVQLGAFSNAANARYQWEALRRRVSAVGALQPSYVRAGALTRLQAGPLTSRAAVDRLCATVRAAGQGCIPVVP